MQKLTNPQNTKTQKQTNLSIFYKSKNELYTIFQGIGYACNNISLIRGVVAVWSFMYGKISKMLR